MNTRSLSSKMKRAAYKFFVAPESEGLRGVSLVLTFAAVLALGLWLAGCRPEAPRGDAELGARLLRAAKIRATEARAKGDDDEPTLARGDDDMPHTQPPCWLQGPPFCQTIYRQGYDEVRRCKTVCGEVYFVVSVELEPGIVTHFCARQEDPVVWCDF